MFLYSSLSREVKMQEEKDLLSWTLYTEIITIICACMQLSAAGLALSSSTASPPSCQVTSFLPAQPGLLRWRLSHLVHLAAFYSGAGRRLKWITTIPFLCAESFSEEVIPLRGNPCGSFLQRSSTGLWGAAYGLCWCCPCWGRLFSFPGPKSHVSTLPALCSSSAAPDCAQPDASKAFGMAALCQRKASIPPSWSGIPSFPLPRPAITAPAWPAHQRPQKWKHAPVLLYCSTARPCLHTTEPQIYSNYCKLTPLRHRIPSLWLKPHPQPTRGINK